MLTSDWHIHSVHSCDQARLPMADLPSQAAGLGIVDYGITDHLHTPYNLPDIVASREAYLAAGPSPRFHFGIEVSCVSQWELDQIARGGHKDPVYGLRQGGPAGGQLAIALTQADIAKFGIEYVVGGTHWPMYVPMERDAVIRDYHRQNLFLATHPLVTILAHPWWWMGHWRSDDGSYPAEPWFDDFGVIPASMHDELASAAVAHDTVVEINIWATLANHEYPERFRWQYAEYLAMLRSRGVKLSVGSDCHVNPYSAPFEQAAAMLAAVGIRDQDLWRLPPSGAA